MTELLARYSAGPAALRAALFGLSVADLKWQYDPAKWSAQQIAGHVADMDQVYAFRMKRIMAEPDARYPGVDQDLWATGLLYQERQLETALRLLEVTRLEMAELLGQVPAATWDRTGVHDQFGAQSLAGLVEKMCNHLELHVQQITAIRRRLRK